MDSNQTRERQLLLGSLGLNHSTLWSQPCPSSRGSCRPTHFLNTVHCDLCIAHNRFTLQLLPETHTCRDKVTCKVPGIRTTCFLREGAPVFVWTWASLTGCSAPHQVRVRAQSIIDGSPGRHCAGVRCQILRTVCLTFSLYDSKRHRNRQTDTSHHQWVIYSGSEGQRGQPRED